MPLVSIAMAVYNGERYLRQQVESILKQTVQDFELIMADDCSKDRTWTLMQELANQDKRIRIYRNDANLGFKDNFQKAISYCTGDYVALSDCDDIWMPNHLEILLDTIGKKAMACGNSTFIDANGNRLGTTLKYQESFDGVPDNDMKKFRSIILFRNTYQGAAMLMRRSFIDKALPIPDEINYHDTWFASLACLCGGINYTGKSIMNYRRIETSITGLRNKRKSKLYRFLHTRFDDDRLYILDSIENRLGDELSGNQKKVIEKIRNILTIYKERGTDIRIYLYEFLHYKSIFSCDLTHWI